MKEIDQSIALLNKAADIREAIKDMYEKYKTYLGISKTVEGKKDD